MRSRVVGILAVAAVVAAGAWLPVAEAIGQEQDEIVVYVATDGEPDAAGTFEDPVSSIAAARDLLAGQTSAESPGAVHIRGGVYPVEETTVFSGAQHSHVTYSAYRGEYVEFTGARTLDTGDFQKLADVSGAQYSSASRLQSSVQDQVYVLDLKAAGIPTGEINKNGFNWVQQPLPPELVVDGASQQLAQYPNGEAKMTRNDLSVSYAPQGARDFFSDKTSNTKTYEQMLQMPGPIFNANSATVRDRFLKWGPPTIWTQQVNQPPHTADPNDTYYVDNSQHETDGWLNGYFGTDWATENLQIYSAADDGFNLRSHYPTMYKATSSGGLFSLVAQNILYELDSAGEYYIDRWNGNDVLYYLPADGTVADKSISLTSLSEPFFTLDGVTGVTFDGVSLNGGTGVGMQLLDCESCTIENSEFSRFSLDAIRIGEDNKELTALAEFQTRRGGHDNRVLNSAFHDRGGGGVWLTGGDRDSLERGDSLVSGNEFWNISKLSLANYTPAIVLAGVGNTASNNYVHDTPHLALQIFGNDMLVTQNRFENVLTDGKDMGAIYSGRDFTYLGNEISYNTFTGIQGDRRWAIYLDDGMSSMNIHHNLFESGSEAVYINSGRASRVTDNVFLDHDFMGFELSFRTKHGATLPVPNQNVHVERFNDMLKAGDGSGFTNTQQNIDIWLAHYADDYPDLAEWYWPTRPDGTACQAIDTNTCTVAAAYENPNSLLVPAGTQIARNVRINTSDEPGGQTWPESWRFTEFGYDHYNPGLNTIQAAADTPEEIGFDRDTRRFAASSTLATTEHFGPEWIEEWNNGFPADAAPVAGELRSTAANKCLDVVGQSTQNWTPLQVWSCWGGANQQWTHTADGELTVYSGGSLKCLDASGSGTSAGTEVIIWTCHGRANQRWELNPDGTVTGVQSGLCLNLVNGATANGTRVNLWDCNGGASQRWTPS